MEIFVYVYVYVHMYIIFKKIIFLYCWMENFKFICKLSTLFFIFIFTFTGLRIVEEILSKCLGSELQWWER